MKSKKSNHQSRRVIRNYDTADTTEMINRSKPLKFEDLGLRVPAVPPTQVVSIRLPSRLLNELKAISSETDIPYHALIKLFLSESVSRFRKRSTA